MNELDNKNATSFAKLWLIRMPLLVFLVLLVLTLMEVLPSAIWLIISAGLFILTLLIVLIGRLHYVKFSFSKEEIIVRFFHLFPLITDYQEILITRSDDPQFAVKYSLYGLIPLLSITIHTSQGEAVYPPIPLSLLSKKELQQLLEELKIS